MILSSNGFVNKEIKAYRYADMLREKTLEFNNRLKGNPFKASNVSWLVKFKARYDIRQLNRSRKKL